MSTKLLGAICVAASIAAAVPLPTHAQDFPTKPVRVILPFAAGTGPDVVFRLIADKLSRTWNQQVVIEARPGGGGIIAMQAARQAPPDGHGLVFAGDAVLTTNQHLNKTLPYEVADFAPIMRVYETPFYVMVAGNGPYQTVSQILAEAKAAPGKLSYGSTNVGSPGHLAGALLVALTGTDMVHVPFRDAQQIFITLANGEIAFAFASAPTAAAHIEAGRVKPIATAMRSRSPLLPNVPTVGESGGPEMEYVPWTALLATRGTPPQIIDKINADVRAALADPTVADRIRLLGNQISPSSPAELAEFVRTKSISNAALVQRIGLAPK